MDDIVFTEDDIQQQLILLGYDNIPRHRLHEFKKDLEQLIRHERSKSQNSSERDSPQSYSSDDRNTPAYGSQSEATYTHKPFATSREMFPQPERQVPLSTYGTEHPSTTARFQQYDSCIMHSLTFPRPTSAPCRLDAENSKESIMGTLEFDSSSSSPNRQQGFYGKPAIKRKVLRKQNGQVNVCDESVHSEAESDAASTLEDRLVRLHKCSEVSDFDLETEIGSLSERSSSDERRPRSAFQLCARDVLRSAETERDSRSSSRPKSFIRPQLDHPHTRNLKKTDPVSKYFQYKQDWEAFKPPGEKERKGLRWGIREQMLYKNQLPPKPQRIYVPNTYEVPTQKKRLALRWEVRHDLANGSMPQKIFYPF
ncbi:centriolar and ciliogenesis-associated protein HYSL1-like [Acipenser ruthenus]|uniref:centriolar and ciliogenesis-associated protein HYSL1-like n=1 Tax=Acipenser ruthenus TaxID=7906 RepID=UPI00145B16CC|nr:centriolar and ciliogenesis-associated protein HYSL1-like [Acipenser ruthenus]XP_033859320.1 centriolar and ciliogenesis-associated protein HYSL1-like [Acipenser ruthenus]